VPQPWLEHGENAWLVPGGDADALAEGCRQVAEDAALRERLGRGALDLHSHFSWPEIAARTLEVYRDVAVH